MTITAAELSAYNTEAVVRLLSLPRRVTASAAPLPLSQESWADHGVFSYTAHQRRAMAKTGEALTDGSFPIKNKPDLDKAIKQYGELDPEQRIEVRKHINKRAKALGISSEIPQQWKNASAIDDFEQDLADALTASLEFDDADTQAVLEMAFTSDEIEALGITELKTFSPKQRKRMATSGSALPDGSFPIKTKADARRAVQAYGRAKNKAAAKKHIIRRARAVGAGDVVPDSWKANAAQEPGVEAIEAPESAAPATPEDVKTGARFQIPMLIPENVESGDGRTFSENSLTSRDTPLALMWQIESDDGHKSSVIVGRIDHIERIPGGIGNCYGVFDTGPYAVEAERMVRAGMLRGVSADLDEFEAQVDEPEDETTITSAKVNVNKGRVMGATLVAKPAFPNINIELIDEGDDVDDYAETTTAVAAAALVAAAAPIEPPAGWFEDPKLSAPTPLTVDDDGRVFGHVALWNVDHIGLPFGTRAPKSASNYAYFRTGVVRAAEGSDIPVGQLTLAGGHAELSLSATDTVKHYDDTRSAVADVAAGEDRNGIWVAGALRPDVTPEQVRALRASAPSGDWRPIKGKLELVACLAVNVPGFPVARARVASGMVQALVAAGAAPLVDMKIEAMAASAALTDRVQALEAITRRALEIETAAVKGRVQPLLEAQRIALTAAAETAKARIDVRRTELSTAADEARARITALRTISAEELSAEATQISDATETVESVPVTATPSITINLNLPAGADSEAIKASVVAALEAVRPFEEGKHPRGPKGKFREVIAHLTDSLKDIGHDSGGDSQVGSEVSSAVDSLHGAADKADAGDVKGATDIVNAAKSTLQEAANAVTNAESKTKLHSASDDLNSLLEHLANTGNQGEGFHFDDLPEPLKQAIQDAADKAESQVKQAVDPTGASQVGQRLESFIKGTIPLTRQELEQILQREVKQSTIGQRPQPVKSAPTPTQPAGR